MRITHILNETYTSEDEEGLQDRLIAVLENGDRFEIDRRDRNVVERAFETRDENFDPDRDLGRNSLASLVVARDMGDIDAEIEREIAAEKAAPKRGQRGHR